MLRKWYHRPRNKKLVRIASAMLLGAAVGASCQFLPEAYRGACHLAAKLLSLFGG